MNNTEVETVIRTEKLCCQAGHRYLLRDVNWEVKRGQHWVVFGMNGCGKTTLLSIVAGFKSTPRAGWKSGRILRHR